MNDKKYIPKAWRDETTLEDTDVDDRKYMP
jgi:hypothetical protein